MTFARAQLAALSMMAMLLFMARDAFAARHRAAVIDADAALLNALDVALSPWGVELDSHAVVGPGATMPMATERARELTRDTRADVVIWISNANGAHALWVYDADANHASARGVPAPPFDETTAAGIALSIKTILRATKVAPPQERFGARPAGDATWQIDLTAGGADYAGTPGGIEARAGAGVSLWPASWHRFGVTLGFEGGTGLRADGPSFTGTAIDVSLRVALAKRWPLTSSVGLDTSIGGGAHVLFVDGWVVGHASAVSIRRVNPSFEPRVALDFAIAGGRVRVAPWIGMVYLTRWQDIRLQGNQVFEMAPLVLQSGIRLSVGLE